MSTKSPYTVTRACFATLWHIAAEEDFITAKNLQIQELERILIIGLPGRDKKKLVERSCHSQQEFLPDYSGKFLLKFLNSWIEHHCQSLEKRCDP